MPFLVGTAGWTIPRQHRSLFPVSPEGTNLSQLQLYASRLRCVEINSSFYRPHRRSTWERWASATPESFRFAVKVPKTVTHVSKLVKTAGALQEFLDAARGLGQKLGPLLIQLPPSLNFNERVASEFLDTLRGLHKGPVALEPRHASWFSASAEQLLRSFEVSRVAADPPKGSELASQPGGWPGLRYWRLHGTPRTYYSEYDVPFLKTLAEQLQLVSKAIETWVIFDNTTLGHAAANAIHLERALQ